jgi:hypothetical protein
MGWGGIWRPCGVGITAWSPPVEWLGAIKHTPQRRAIQVAPASSRACGTSAAAMCHLQTRNPATKAQPSGTQSLSASPCRRLRLPVGSLLGNLLAFANVMIRFCLNKNVLVQICTISFSSALLQILQFCFVIVYCKD